MFPLDMQYSTAGDQDLEMGTGCKQMRKHRGSHHHLLKVVEEEQQVFLPQKRFQKLQERSLSIFFDPKRLGNGGNDQGRVGNRSQWDKADAIGERIKLALSDLYAQACFTDPSRASEGHQADVPSFQEGTRLCHLLFASNEWRDLRRQMLLLLRQPQALLSHDQGF